MLAPIPGGFRVVPSVHPAVGAGPLFSLIPSEEPKPLSNGRLSWERAGSVTPPRLGLWHTEPRPFRHMTRSQYLFKPTGSVALTLKFLSLHWPRGGQIFYQ